MFSLKECFLFREILFSEIQIACCLVFKISQTRGFIKAGLA